MFRRKSVIALAAAAVVLVAIQFHRPERANPPSDPAGSFDRVVSPPQEVAVALRRACRDCHSNETAWPWYSNVAPASWLIASDVVRGRSHLNFSEWNRLGAEMSRSQLAEVCEQVKKGEMPLWYFQPLHPESRLASVEVSGICGLSGQHP